MGASCVVRVVRGANVNVPWYVYTLPRLTLPCSLTAAAAPTRRVCIRCKVRHSLRELFMQPGFRRTVLFLCCVVLCERCGCGVNHPTDTAVASRPGFAEMQGLQQYDT